jgi:hypothetical protein
MRHPVDALDEILKSPEPSSVASCNLMFDLVGDLVMRCLSIGISYGVGGVEAGVGAAGEGAS